LHQCLESAQATVDPARSEIIVVDNASTDGSWQMVREHFPHVKLVQNAANLGFAKASNIGLRYSGGKYLCLVNSDVRLLEGCLDRLAATLEQNPRIGMIGPRILGRDGRVQRSCMGFPTLWNTLCAALALPAIFPGSAAVASWLMEHKSFNRLERVDVVNGCFLVIRREALREVGLLDEDFFMYGEDVDWCRRFWKAGWEVAYSPDAVAVHYGGASSANAPVRFYVEMHRSRLRYFTKHHGWFVRQGFRGVATIHQVFRLVGNLILYILRPARRAELSLKIRRSAACLVWLSGVSTTVELAGRPSR
jgi:GT2 family glycosyltransferase